MTVIAGLASAVMILDVLLLLPVGVDARWSGGTLSLAFRAGPLVVKRLSRRPLARPAQGGNMPFRKLPRPVLCLAAEQGLRAWARLRRRVRLDRVKLRAVAGGRDPYAAAMAYARTGLLLEGIGALYRERAGELDLKVTAAPDRDCSSWEAGLTASVRLGYMIGAAVCFGNGLLRAYFRYKKAEG